MNCRKSLPHVPGVVATSTGYINGERDTTYADVAAGSVKAYMGVEVTYNPKKMDVSKLLDLLFGVVNPYVPDGQGKGPGGDVQGRCVLCAWGR